MPRRPRRPRRFRTYSASMRHRAALHSILWINSSMLESPGIAFTVFAFLLVLGPLVFVHEYGHYIVGRWCGVKADAFSIGFGRKIVGWTDKRGTLWRSEEHTSELQSLMRISYAVFCLK